MTNKQKLTGAAASVAAIAIASIMIVRHGGNPVQTQQKVRASALGDDQIVRAIQDANVPVDGLLVKSVGGVVVVRGNGDKAAVENVLKGLNVQRVANLVTPAYKGDDEAIRRQAERQLAGTRALDGCQLKVSCERGVIRVSGTVQREIQADAARQALRGIQGVTDVKVDLVPRAAGASL